MSARMSAYRQFSGLSKKGAKGRRGGTKDCYFGVLDRVGQAYDGRKAEGKRGKVAIAVEKVVYWLCYFLWRDNAPILFDSFLFRAFLRM